MSIITSEYKDWIMGHETECTLLNLYFADFQLVI